jgi:hypothetical protein
MQWSSSAVIHEVAGGRQLSVPFTVFYTGLYRFRLEWPDYSGGPLHSNWITVVVFSGQEMTPLPSPSEFPKPKIIFAAPRPGGLTSPPR